MADGNSVGIITIVTEKVWIHFSCDVFMAVSCRGILNPLIFTKTWSMQAWIPVVSSSLCFRKSAFRFRVNSILKWTVYIKLKVSWLRPFFFGAWAKQAVIKPIAVMYELTKNNSEDSVRLLGTIIQSIFCVQSGASIRLTGLKLSGESRYPGGFPKKKTTTFVAPFFQTRLTAPGSQSRDGFERHHQSLFRYDVCLLSLRSFCWVNDHINGDLSPPKQSRNALWQPYPVSRATSKWRIGKLK